MKRILLILFLLTAIIVQSKAQRVLKSTAVLDGFYTLPFEDMLDTLARKGNIRFIYDRQMIAPLQVTEQFNNDSVKDILALLCRANNLHYWVESDQAIYLIQSTEDLPKLKKMMHEKNPNLAYAPKELTKSQNNNNSIMVQREVVVEKPTEIKTFEPFTLSGRIIDQVNGESLPSAVVKVANTNISTTTNADGYFTLFKVPADTCKLLINYVGYVSETYYLNSENIKKPITIGLFTAVKSLSEVTIMGKKGESLMNLDKRKTSVLQLSPSKLDELPNVGERDILRSFQLMPGISASNESSSGAYVRGGTPDQNLVLFDGFTVYQVDHLYGFFSAFNANSVKDVTMYKGGFSSKFGGRLSSVTDIVGKEGNSNETNFGGDISLLSANIYYERPLNKKSTLLLTYRRSYEGPLYNKIFEKFNSSSTTGIGGGGAPGMGNRPGGGGGFGGGFEQNISTPASAFYDLNAKYTYAPDDKNRFSWSLYQGNDDLDNSKTIEVPSFISNNGGGITNTDKTNYGNLGSSLKWSRRWNTKTYSNTLMSFSTYHSERDNSNLITLTDTAGNETETRIGTFEKNKLSDFSLKSDWETQIKGNTKLLYGTFASYQNVTYDYSESDTSSLIDQKAKALIGGAYAELEFNPLEKLQVKPSIRASFYSQTNKPYFEPRLSASYLLNDKFTLKGSTGRFYQFTNRVIREDILSGSRDFWVLANGTSIPVSSANHFILGASYETDRFLFDVEGYYKQLDNLTEYSQRIVGDRRRGGTLEEHFYTGTGYTRGIEFLVQKTKGRYTGWISYTLSEAINNFEAYGGEFPASHDTGHELKSVNLYRYGRWSFAATWIFATGKPYTAPLSSYSIDNYSGSRRTFLAISDKNSLRLPSYHRLDLSATYDLIKIDSRKVGSIGFSIFNAYNRQNTWYQQYYVINNQVITSNVNYLGLTPNLTLSIKWK